MYRWGAHHGEEPPIRGRNGSGTLFLTHCTLACLYCQNFKWSQEHRGTDFGVEEFAGIMRGLAEEGCHNWNLVTPTPWLPQIRAAATIVKNAGISLPFVYNTSGFERIEVVEAYRDLVDVVLTDLRYSNPVTAAEASGSADYVRYAREFVKWAWENVGEVETDAEGVARKGTVCRLLVLPGKTDEVIGNLEWLAENVGTGISVSVMKQYTPVHKAPSLPDWNRKVSQEEFARVTECLRSLGFENGWVQEIEEEQVGTSDLLCCTMPEGGSTAVGLS